MTATPRIAFLASTADDAQAACAKLVDRHGDVPPEDAEVLVALGGDGFMLQTLHRHGRHEERAALVDAAPGMPPMLRAAA